jgi:hypothetical protein
VSMLRALAAVTGLILLPFGAVQQRLAEENPWRGNADDASIMVLVRAERSAQGACRPWLRAVSEEGLGTRIEPEDSHQQWLAAFQSWQPWDRNDLETVSDCDDFPCAVKLNRPETRAMAAAAEESRLGRFEELIRSRVQRYEASGPEEYEFEEGPKDPWAYLDENGYRPLELKRPPRGTLWARKFNLDPGRMRTLHQILEARFASSATEAARWTRAAYTDHYFEAWGEWTELKCGEKGQGFTLVQALIVDFDLLKKKDLLSRVARGKMRSEIRENGQKYLDQASARLRLAATAPPSPSPSPVASPSPVRRDPTRMEMP